MTTHGELFAGIGGFGLGFDNAGMQTIWHVEIDKNCQNVLRRHYPDTLILADVCEVGKHNLSYVDVISFGSPCQDLSIAGRRKGLIDGTRSNLFFEAIRIVDELKPVIAVWENVPGALSSNSGRDFAKVLGAFRDIGARDIAWRILDAQYFGIPQRRRRIFLVADFRGERAAEVLFEREGVPGHPPARRKAGEEVAYSIRASPSHSGDKGDGGINTTLLAYNIQQNDGGEHKRKDRPNGGMYVNETEQSLTVGGTDLTAICMSTGQANAGIVKDGSPSLTGAHEQPIVATSWTLRGGKEGGGKGYLGLEDRAMTLGGQEQMIWEMQHASETYRESGNIAPTLQQRMGTGGNQVPLVGVRRLTPTECERLQGFPDGWTDGQADSPRYRQLGNAVAVPVVEWIGRRIIEASNGN